MLFTPANTILQPQITIVVLLTREIIITYDISHRICLSSYWENSRNKLSPRPLFLLSSKLSSIAILNAENIFILRRFFDIIHNAALLS